MTKRSKTEQAPEAEEREPAPDAASDVPDVPEADRAEGVEATGDRSDEASSDVDELARVEAELEVARAEKLRLLAEFRNFRQRMERDRARIRNDAAAAFFGGLLPIVHDLERAREAATQDGAGASIAEGIDLVLRRFRDFMQREGLVEVDPIGESFDENTMEAMGMVPSDEHAEGCVAQVFQRGLLLGERLIEPARVLVSTGPAPTADDAK